MNRYIVQLINLFNSELINALPNFISGDLCSFKQSIYNEQTIIIPVVYLFSYICNIGLLNNCERMGAKIDLLTAASSDLY